MLAQTKLIDELLDVSRIITGKLYLSVRKASLGGVIEAACESMRPAAAASGIQIAFERFVEEERDAIVGDADRLNRSWNLLSTGSSSRLPGAGDGPAGADSIRISRSASSTPAAESVRSSSHVFRTVPAGGQLGGRAREGWASAAIARHLTELHGGSIAVESPGENLGSTFIVQLPAVALGLDGTDVQRRRHAEPPRRPASEAPDLNGLSVLVVEDDADARELAEHTLRVAGAEVVAVGSASEALEQLRRSPPSVLVSDIGLPYQDGYSLIDTVRKLPAGQGGDVPAVAVTAYAREEDRMKALIAGFQGHLTKPFEPAALAAAVGALAGRHSPAHEPAAAQQDVLRIASGNGDAQPTRILIVEDDRDSREGLRELLQVWGHLVEVAQDGTEGIEKALELRPGVALIDIGLPGLDGYEVAHRIREAFGKRPILLVALTGYVDSEAGRRVLESGFDAHLPKPINIEKLKPLLERAVSPSPSPLNL